MLIHQRMDIAQLIRRKGRAQIKPRHLGGKKRVQLLDGEIHLGSSPGRWPMVAPGQGLGSSAQIMLWGAAPLARQA